MRERRTLPLFEVAGYFGILLVTCVAIYGLLWVIDFGGVGASAAPWNLIAHTESVQTLASFGEVALGILGVTITVVAIIVELAANRYTARITEMFVRDPINVFVMGFFVVTAVLVIWVDMSLFHPGVFPTTMVGVSVGWITVALLLILPYFAYVFDFLSPVAVVQRIEGRGSNSITRLARKGSRYTSHARSEVCTSVEQLGDIALNSVDRKDKAIGIATVDALAGVARTHIETKELLPTDWFDAEPLMNDDQDFVAFHPDIIRALTERRTWVEMKILRQYQHLFGDAMNKMRDINHLVAIRTRQLAVAGAVHHDEDSRRLCIRFLNTYMRAAINARDVRTAYNLMNEFRVLGEQFLTLKADSAAVEVAEFVKLYGQIAFSAQIPFILESAAYDLCGLLENAYQDKAHCHDELLKIFLDVDREPEGGKNQETSLRGVRKAQIKLATFYLVQGEEGFARQIFADMADEKPDRMDSIRGELEDIEEAEFWEVSDRGFNFEYLTVAQRDTLDTFFSWFPASQ